MDWQQAVREMHERLVAAGLTDPAERLVRAERRASAAVDGAIERDRHCRRAMEGSDLAAVADALGNTGQMYEVAGQELAKVAAIMAEAERALGEL